MENGTVVHPPDSLEVIAQRTAQSVASLAPEIRSLDQPDQYPVAVSQSLEDLTDRTSRRLTPQLST